ncbi:YebC/PmpR family DNA-binding transcriptional regulator [Helicobacter cappadocius]|uniref:Probable transcriptional regulatory protein Q5I04_07780 n=1 Tax=Helicobacter cappadocius TaxID=3063998 RepID=A0AA90PI35_9HELI|nr:MULTISPECIES: YebC/PmpR family DNA-binding transcriptional regulator [unclassified Helicobacter]MDO7253802.1 YebC/PmpR family DNA-binding transcriptional regulator [Helicobacter sp. faydin-H75]MDP2538682.1 YebC/PmpR family DNA-binding transcriptional regulator [Helicobacter sp. faydin-H76]
MGRAFEYRRAAKEKRWDKMSKVFPKLAKTITVAAKEGGSDPEMNAKLRTAIANAKAQNMPKDNIDAAIKRASGKDGVFSEVTYEGKASYGVLIFIECTTDNTTRTVANIKSYFNKTPGSSMLTNGSLEFMFSRKSVFEIDKKDIDDLAIQTESLELNLIDYGLQELESIQTQEGEILVIYGDYTDFGKLNDGLESLKIPIKKASLKRIANTPINLSVEQLSEIEKLLDKIEDDDDVQAVYTNIN